MSLPLSSQSDFYTLFVQELQNAAPELTDTLDGSIIDSLAGVFSIAAMEVQRYIIDQFNKCFIDLANGPAVTGGNDDLQTLAVDHYGSAFARPGAVAAIDTATFSRPSGSVTTYGQITIAAGTVVKTSPDANGNTQRYTTNSNLVLTNTHGGTSTDISGSVGITAVVAGAAGDAAAGTITTIETALLDPTITVTNAGNTTGQDAEDDSSYRETIRNLIAALAGATLTAIEAKAKTVAGVAFATALEQSQTVIGYNTSTSSTTGTYFTVARAFLYIGDSTGSASQALISAVSAALDAVRACGVWITVQSAVGQTVNWTASMTLNPSGPNYAALSANPALIITAMKNYINNLPVGTSFIRSTANAAILAIYGPSGTNDLTAFTTSVPSGDVSASATTKFVAGTVSIV